MIERGYCEPSNNRAKWVAECRLVGKGLPALKYLSRDLYRGIINERNILAADGEQVTFGVIDSKFNRYKARTVPSKTFLWLVYQPVLPKGFRRICGYGYLNGNAKKALADMQRALGVIAIRLPNSYDQRTRVVAVAVRHILLFVRQRETLLIGCQPFGWEFNIQISQYTPGINR